jgi:DNA-directed RNA polymerase subunit beta'
MAVHVPLSTEAQMEARMLMLAPNNIFSPSSGKPITTPSQDIPLGCYYLTQKPRGEDAAKDKRLPIFGTQDEVELALTDRAIRTHTRILFKNPDFGLTTVYGDPEPKVLETTAGRVVFNQIWPKALGFYNKVCGKKQLSDIIWRCYKASGQQTTVETLDLLKELGFREATKAGISIGINDMMIPKEKTQLLEKAYREVAEVAKQYRRGIITDGERKNKVQDIWTHTGEEIANALFRTLEYNDNKRDMNPVFMMVDSGARGNRTQVKQLAGMRGQMAKPSGEIIEQPITANFREGLTVLEYFISAHGARKGLADTALKTADSGYLTRKLVDAAQDVIITIDDCGTANGIVVRPIYEGDEEVVSLSTRIIGRTSCETVKDPITNKAIIKANQLVDEETAAALDKIGHEQLKIRSALTCESKRGICVHCYGRNLSTGGLIKLGEAVGIIAARKLNQITNRKSEK